MNTTKPPEAHEMIITNENEWLIKQIDILLWEIEKFIEKYINKSVASKSGLLQNFFLSSDVLKNHLDDLLLRKKQIKNKKKLLNEIKVLLFNIFTTLNKLNWKESNDVFWLSLICWMDIKSEWITFSNKNFIDDVFPFLNLNFIIFQLKSLKIELSWENNIVWAIQRFFKNSIEEKMENNNTYTQWQISFLNNINLKILVRKKVTEEIEVHKNYTEFPNWLKVARNWTKFWWELFSLEELKYIYNFLGDTDFFLKRLFLKEFCYMSDDSLYTIDWFKVYFDKEKWLLYEELWTQEQNFKVMLLWLENIFRDFLMERVRFYEDHINLENTTIRLKDVYDKKEIENAELISLEELEIFYDLFLDRNKKLEFLTKVCYFNTVWYKNNKKYYLCSGWEYVHIWRDWLEIIKPDEVKNINPQDICYRLKK